jgi:tetratricopeptide (TPR) repeat protein
MVAKWRESSKRGVCALVVACLLAVAWAPVESWSAGARLAASVSGEEGAAPISSDAQAKQALAVFERGQAAAKDGRLRAATEAYVEVIRLKPDFAEAYLALGRINHEAGRPEKAIALYRLSLEHDPNLVEAYQGLGNLHFDQNRLEEALGFYQEVVKRSPNSPVGHNSIGNCYYGLQKFQEALEMWQKAIDLDPAYPRAYFNRAVLYDGVHTKDKAIDNYRKFLELAGAEHESLVEDARMRIEELEKPESPAPAASEAPSAGGAERHH